MNDNEKAIKNPDREGLEEMIYRINEKYADTFKTLAEEESKENSNKQ